MAIKKRDDKQKSKLGEVMKDYRWENLLLGPISLISAALAGLIISGTLKVSESFPVLGTAKNGIIFAWFLLVISIFGIFLVLYPFFVPAWPEMKKINWPTRKKYFLNLTRVVLFTLILTTLLYLFDFLILKMFGGAL